VWHGGGNEKQNRICKVEIKTMEKAKNRNKISLCSMAEKHA